MRWVGIMHDYLRRGSNSILIRCSRSSISVAHTRRTPGMRFCTTLPNRIFLVITHVLLPVHMRLYRRRLGDSALHIRGARFCSKLNEAFVSSDAFGFEWSICIWKYFDWNKRNIFEERFSRTICLYRPFILDIHLAKNTLVELFLSC